MYKNEPPNILFEDFEGELLLELLFVLAVFCCAWCSNYKVDYVFTLKGCYLVVWGLSVLSLNKVDSVVVGLEF